MTGERHHSHSFWTDAHKRGERSARPQGKRWYAADWTQTPQRAEEAAAEADRVRAWCGAECADGTPCGAAVARLASAPFKTLALRIPADAPERHAPGFVDPGVDTFAAGLISTFGSSLAEKAQCGVSAITHLVAASADWGDEGAWTHVGRRALMAAAGAWMPAPMASPGGEPKRYVSLSSALVQASGTATKAAVGRTLARLFAAAHALGRTPAVFGFECDTPEAAPWLARHPVRTRRRASGCLSCIQLFSLIFS